ncbi:ankyrin, partial [Peniophora sp. CONT]
AAANGLYSLVAQFLDEGMDVDLVHNKLGYTALHFASSNGYTDIVELLLDHGAAIDAIAEQHKTPLLCALAHNHHDTISLLFARGATGIDVNMCFSDGTTPLSLASEAGFLEIVTVLLALGAD